jgi:small subunit ribosomal protein S16
MSVRIRLRRVGRKKQPYFRVVVMPGDAPRDGAYIEEVGFYNPRTRPAVLTMDLEKVDAWLGKGAEVSDSAASLIRKARKGGDGAIRVVESVAEAASLKTASKPERRSKSAAPTAETAAPAVEPAVEPETDPLEGAAPDAEKEPPAEATTGPTKPAVEALAPKEGVAETAGAPTGEAPEAESAAPEAEAAEAEVTEAEEGKVEEGKVEEAAAVEAAAEEPQAEAETEAPEAEAVETEAPKADAKKASKSDAE